MKPTDTLCFQVQVIQKVFIAAEQKKVLEQQVYVLNERITGLQKMIVNLNEKDSATVEGYQLEIRTMREQQDIFVDQINSFEKLLKKERRKRWWTAAGGFVSVGALTYLYLTK